MVALRAELGRQGFTVFANVPDRDVAMHVLHGIWFDVDAFRARQCNREAPVVHRIDGPVSLYRADRSGRELDEQCFAYNREFATASVFQSQWSLEHNMQMGFQPINPTVIPNASDPDVFHAKGRIPYSAQRKIRLVSVSWSNNAGKGGALYKRIENQLDWNRFEYTFVGNTAVTFEHIRHVAPLPSNALAELLRQHDVFITASQNDPCSNSVVEALSCGLPVLYLNSGGHSELVGAGGLAFEGADDVISQLDCLMADMGHFRQGISAPCMAEVARRYVQAAGVATPWGK